MRLPAASRWAELEPLIDELLALEPGPRQQRLDEIVTARPALADELRALLGALDGAAAITGFGPEPPPRPAAARGDLLGPWQLVEPLGEGGMGSVWRARRGDGRYEGEVAIKLLRAGLVDASAHERFRREGAILARLRHPGIAQLQDAGVSPHGQPYLVLELVRGESIDVWCRQHRLGVRATLELFLQVLDAVAAAHGLLVIHRDLKPSNILVDEAGRIRLLDFGIARLLDDTDAALTREGALALTPRYAAPEQVDGAAALSVSTDVYALGVVLHELLTGRHPSGLTAQATAVDYLRELGRERQVRASEHDPERRRELRGDVDTILAKALAPRPQDRYASVGAMAEDLHRHLRREPIAARPASAWYRFVRLLQRHPLEATVVAAALASVPAGTHVRLVVLGSMALGASVALWQARVARAEARAARVGQARADAVKGFIASTFEQAVPREGAGGTVTAGDLLRSAVERVGRELRGQPDVAAELLAIAGKSFLHLGDVAAARAMLPDAVRRCEQAFGPRHAITLAARCRSLQAANVMGEIDESERMLAGLLADLRLAMPASARELVAALRSASFVRTKRGDEAAAVAALREAIDVGRRHLGEADEDTLAAAGLLGNTLNTFSRFDEALAVLEDAVAAARRAYGALRPHGLLAMVESFRGEVLTNMGRSAAAADALQQVLADQLALDGIDTDRNRFTRFIFGRALADAGAPEAALDVVREAIAVDARLVSRPTADKGAMHAHLALLLADLGRVDEARVAIDRADELVAASGSAQLPAQWNRRLVRARIEWLAGDVAAALARVETVLAEPALKPLQRATGMRTRVGALRALGRSAEWREALPAMIEAGRAATPLHLGRALIDAATLLIDSADAEQRRQGRQWAEEAVRVLAPHQQPESVWLARAQALCAAGRSEES